MSLRGILNVRLATRVALFFLIIMAVGMGTVGVLIGFSQSNEAVIAGVFWPCWSLFP